MGTAKELSPIVNLSLKMNTRKNNETLDSDANQTGLELIYNQNADAFFTQAATTRQGVTDVGGGMVNATVTGITLFDYNTTTIPSGNIEYVVTNTAQDPDSDDYLGMIIVPSGSLNILSGTFIASAAGNASQITRPEWGYDIDFAVKLFTLNQVSKPALGLGFFSGTNTSSVYNIALSGTYSGPPYPLIPSTVPGSVNFIAEAITTVNFGSIYTFNPAIGTFTTPEKAINFNFKAPAPLFSGSVYFVRIEPLLTSGTSQRQIPMKYIYKDVESGINTRLADETQISFGVRGIIEVGPDKSQLYTDIDEYARPSYVLDEFATANHDFVAPLVSGTDFTGLLSNSNVKIQNIPFVTSTFDGSKRVPNFDTTTVEFGQIFNIPSGNWPIFGSYIYLTPNDKQGWDSFTRTKHEISGNGYDLGYIAKLSEITQSSGSIASGNFQILDRNVIAAYTGSYVFNDLTDNVSGSANSVLTPNYNLHRIYSKFGNLPTINVSTATPYLASWELYDFNTGQPFTDYSYKNISSGPFAPTTLFSSFMEHGFDNSPQNVSGSYVTNYNGDGKTFIEPSGDPVQFPNPTKSNLTCGILTQVSGAGITSIYDYRAGTTRSQAIMFTQLNNLEYFDLVNPHIHNIIYTGGAIDNHNLWSHTTYQNLLFSHQYAKTSGVCWDQIFHNPSGNSTQLHGLQPVFSGLGATISIPSGSAAIPSGSDFNIIATTQILSGGLRASDIYNTSGNSTTGNAFQIFGIASPSNDATYPYDIFHASGVSATGTAQYNFDVFSNGTYIWASRTAAASGDNLYFLANLCDNGGNLLENPLPNNNTWNSVAPFQSSGSGVYIYDVSFTGANSLQVPNVLPQYDQTYITNQIPVPRFKKIILFNNMLIGIGDPNNTSRLWYTSAIQTGGGPQVFGVDTGWYGFYDIDPDNGQELTGIEVFKGQLIIFKERSTYSGAPTGIFGDPLNIQNISPDKGCVGVFSTAATDYGVFALSTYGPVLATYYSVETIGDSIINFYNTLDKTDLIYSEAILDINSQQVMWNISNNNESPDNQTALVYSYAEQSWQIRKDGIWLSAGLIGDVDNFPLLMGGTSLGQIELLNSGERIYDEIFIDGLGNTLLQSITMKLITPWLNFKNSQDLKQMISLRANSKSSNQILRIDVYHDQNEDKIVYTRFLKMNGTVENRVSSLAGTCRTFKLVITTVGPMDETQLNSIQFGYINRGQSINI